MLYTKFHGNQPPGSEEEGFSMFFTIYGHVGLFGHVTSIIFNFHFHVPKS